MVNNISIYSKDSAGLYISANDALIKAASAKCFEDVIGVSDKDLSWGETASGMMGNDAFIVKTGETRTYFERSMLMGKEHTFRSFKAPIVGHYGKIVGVQGVSVPVSDLCLIPLTKQQTVCIKYLALGMTYKQIARELGLSQKTVEHYIEATKLKLGCQSRSELVLQAVERGLVGVF